MKLLLSAPCTLLALLPAVIVAQPSRTPNCWLCPGFDLQAVPLATSDYSVDPYQCSYGDAGACTYDQTSGFLVGDDNADFCPAQGDFDCAPARRRNARSPLPRSPRPASPAASEPKPQVMKVRAKLGGKRKQVVRK
ncbi:hypothetical protein CC2G_004754 [Coprinopsis cinerea AmutBmut pab1-1]|nr:hypothetical protein CC2G_004754 [Coprinopsis cinerea AmutBmut pab1-1]